MCARKQRMASRRINAGGYVQIAIERDGRLVSVAEHRFVMERHLGRKLKSSEHVHHIDGDGQNNRIDNLRCYSHGEHIRHHRRSKPAVALKSPAMPKVRKLVAESGLTYREIVERMGYAPQSARQSVSQFLRSQNPTIDVLVKFAKAMNVSIKDLL